MSIKCTVCGALALPCLCGYMQMTNHPANNNDYSRGYSDGWQAATKQTHQPDEYTDFKAVAEALINVMAIVDNDEGLLSPFDEGEWLESVRAATVKAANYLQRAPKRESGDDK